MKVSFFTCNSFDKIHPRIEMQKRILEDEGYDVSIVRASLPKEKGLRGLLNMKHLKYFRWGAIKEFKEKLDSCDIAHVYDFQLLPLAKYAKRKGKKVIYETLDDNVFLHFYELEKRIPFLSSFKSLITNFFAKKEREFSVRYCDRVIVNSSNLLSKFNKEQASLIYYASNLKFTNHEFDSSKEVSFVYVGKMTVDKGAAVYNQLIKDYNKKLIFYGHFGDEDSSRILQSNPLVEQRGNKDVEGLIKSLKTDVNDYNLIGLSIIFPVNESYRLQEANKDIDYITMSVPFIGNTRPPTLEKINKGFGILHTDKESIESLISNKNNLYNKIVANSTDKGKEYSEKSFRSKLLNIYSLNK